MMPAVLLCMKRQVSYGKVSVKIQLVRWIRHTVIFLGSAREDVIISGNDGGGSSCSMTSLEHGRKCF